MRIAIYNTNPSAKSADPNTDHYGQMFEDMLRPEMPGATFEHFDVMEGAFPDTPTEFNAVIVTGSSAFVTDGSAWIETLFSHIRSIDKAGTKLFAVCFGHQAVAVALGGRVENRDIVLGALEINITRPKDWMLPAAESLRLFGGNFQQVVELPNGLEVLASHPDCPIAMMARGQHLMTVQFHPEFSAEYMHRYVDQISEHISDDSAAVARQEFETGADGATFAKWAAGFLAG
jgi:GMP synthase-like glutamine amidotransferase